MGDMPNKKDGWGSIAHFIITKELDKSWMEDAPLEVRNFKINVKPSFTQWGKDRAKEIGISKFLFWQYRRAGLFYNKLPEISNIAPQIPLKELSEQISPENLSELQKIYRAVPRDLFDDLCKRIIEKKDIGRKELRSLWKSLSPALQGATARRRDVDPFDLHVDIKNSSAVFSVLEGLIIFAFKEYSTRLLGIPSRAALIDIRDLPRDEPFYIDFVIIAPGKSASDKPKLHGFTFYWPGKFDSSCELQSFATDFHWIIYITNEEAESRTLESTIASKLFHKNDGLITIYSTHDTFNFDKISIINKANANIHMDNALKSELAMRILLQELS